METLYQLRTTRLILRPLTKNDYLLWKESYTSMLPPQNKWDAANRIPISLTKSDFNKVIQEHIKHRKTEVFFDYAVIDKKTNKYIGRVSLMNIIRSVTQSAFIGYTLFNNYWGKGFAEEAVDGLIKLAFTKHKLHRVAAGIEPDNKRSIRLAKKLGMRKEGTTKNIVFIRNEWQDLVQYALTCEDRKMKWGGSVKVRKT